MREKNVQVQGVVQAAAVLSAVALVSKIFSFLRNVLIARKIQAVHTDAYFVAILVPLLFGDILSRVLLNALVPVFRGYIDRNQKAELWRLVSTVVTAILLISVLGCITYGLWADFFSHKIASGLSTEQIALTVDLIRIVCVLFLFILLSSVATAILNAHKHFSTSAYADLAFQVFPLIAIAFFHRTGGIYAVTIGLAVGGLSQAAIQWLVIFRLGFRFRPFNPIGNREIIFLGRAGSFLFGAGIANQARLIFERNFASRLTSGTISSLSYANGLSQLPLLILVRSLSRAIFPTLSQSIMKGDLDRVNDVFTDMVKVLLLLLVPISFFFAIHRSLIAVLIFSRVDILILIVDMLFVYSVAICLIGINTIMARVFIGFRDTATPSIAILMKVAANLALMPVLIHRFSHVGLPLAFAAAALVELLVLSSRIQAKIGRVDLKPLLSLFLKVVLSAGVMGIVGWEFRKLALIEPAFVQLAFVVLISVGCYYGLLRILGVREWRLMLSRANS